MAKRRTNLRARKKKRKDFLGVGMLLLAAIALGIGGVYFYKTTSARNTDLETGCLTSGIDLQNIILFDKSDALNQVQKLSIRKELNATLSESPINTLFSVYLLDANKSHVPERILHACLPKSGKDASKFTENQRRIEKKWKENFLAPFQNALDSLLVDNPSKTSPIMEAVQQLSFKEQIGETPHRQQLIILSDMLQNTDGLNQYSGIIDFIQFKDTSYYASVRSKLDGLQIEVLYVGRGGRESLQTNRHGMFWESYFDDQNASLNSIERIAGE